jgi:putative DNA primase/helicase
MSGLGEAMAQFRDAMRAAGIGGPEQITADGRLHRFRGDGDKSGCKNCFYVLHADGHPAGAFGSWRLGIRETWRADGPPPDPAELERNRRIFQAARERAEAERQDAHQATAAYAARLWHGSEPADPAHPYLVAKAVQPHGLRQRGVTLFVPLGSLDRDLWNLQRIGENGTKRFLQGGRVTGLASPIGDLEAPGRLLICEGWATGATLHEATGAAVLAAMNAGNLRPVALAARERWPEREIVVAADNDRKTAGNPGVAAATRAAAAIGGRLMVPEFPPGCDGTDWNDLHRALSKNGVPGVPGVPASKSKPFSGTPRPNAGVPGVLERVA